MEADDGTGWWREADVRSSTSLLLATLPEGRRPVWGVREVDVLQHRGAGGDGEEGARQHAGTAAQADSVRSHRQERRPFGLTSLEVGGWRRLRGVGGAWRQDAERWLNWGGAGLPRRVLTEPVALQLLEVAQRRRSQRQGVRKHPAPEGALRLVVTRSSLINHLASESTQYQKVH